MYDYRIGQEGTYIFEEKDDAVEVLEQYEQEYDVVVDEDSFFSIGDENIDTVYKRQFFGIAFSRQMVRVGSVLNPETRESTQNLEDLLQE